MRAKALIGVLGSLSLFAVGCGGITGEYVSLVCECIHCDDWDEQFISESLDTNAEIAEIYGCDAEFESLVQCEIDEGECNTDKAAWEVVGSGNCNGSLSLGVPCMTDTECATLPNATCVNMQCAQKACSDNLTPCATDDECPGEYKCADEQADLVECEDDSADDKSYVGGT